MLRHFLILSALAGATSVTGLAAERFSPNGLVTTIRELKRIDGYHSQKTRDFAVTGTVLKVMRNPTGPDECIVDDGTDRMMFFNVLHDNLENGDRIVASGRAFASCLSDLYADILTSRLDIDVIASGPAPEHERRTVVELVAESRDWRLVETTGTVANVFRDDIDRSSAFLQLRDGMAYLTVATRPEAFERLDPSRLIGATVRVRGILNRDMTGLRIFFGPHLSSGDITLVHPPDGDPCNAPLLNPLGTTDPRAITARKRGSIVGTVRCVRADGTLVLAGSRGRIHNVRLADGVKPPRPGERIRAAGRPATDLYHLNLIQAFWCRAETVGTDPRDSRGQPPENAGTVPTETVSIRDILPITRDGCYAPQFHGTKLTLTGIVSADAGPAQMHGGFILATEGQTVPVELPSHVTAPVVGSRIAVTGIWCFDIGNWRPDDILPLIAGFALVVRDARDITVLANPPWWSPARFLILAGILSALLATLFAWNVLLRKLIERRSRALAEATLTRRLAEQRARDRTNLAVELHDTLSQTLAGIAFRLDAAETTAPTNAAATQKQLAIARQTLNASRQELRNCLWDLRNETLDAKSATEAVERTIRPHLGRAKASVRLDIRRARIHDETFHAILRIARELVVNAVRHGHAGRITVAGAADDGAIRLSVQDDGCGFDPGRRPGPEEGHFGLQGVAERLARMNGTLDIESRPGKGAKISITIPR